MITPLHEARVCGKRLRFFRTPLNDGRPDLPWHSVDDLQSCLGLSRAQRKIFLRMLQNDQRMGPIQTVATTDGLISIAPHFAAQGMIGAIQQVGMAKPEADAEYAVAGVEACKKLTGGMSFQNGLLEWMAAAMKRWE